MPVHDVEKFPLSDIFQIRSFFDINRLKGTITSILFMKILYTIYLISSNYPKILRYPGEATEYFY